MDFLSPCLQWLKLSTARTAYRSFTTPIPNVDQHVLSYECHGPTLVAFTTYTYMRASNIRGDLREEFPDQYEKATDEQLNPLVEEIKIANEAALSEPIDGVKFTRQGKDLTVESNTEHIQMIHYASGPNTPDGRFAITFPKYLTFGTQWNGYSDCTGEVESRLTEEGAAYVWNNLLSTSRINLTKDCKPIVAMKGGILHHLDHIQRIEPGDIIEVDPELGEYATFVPDTTKANNSSDLITILRNIENEYAYIWNPV